MNVRNVVVGALLGLGAMPLHAQMPATPPHDSATAAQKTPIAPAKPANANAPAKDASDQKKAAAKKPAPKKAEPRKAEPKKTPPKNTPPKKTEPDAKKPTVVHSTKTMELRDEKGNVIPTNPEAYDVSSALPAKTPPKKK